MAEPIKGRMEYIDALRGFAILGVMLTHAASLIDVTGPIRRVSDLGAYGVQLFFVVSAFTIFLTYERARLTEQAPVANFFIRRLLRIVPLYWLGIVLYTAVYGLGSRGWLAGPELWHYPMHITLMNLLDPRTTSSVVPGGWSISCEVLFYLTVPMWFLWIRSARRAAILVAASLLLGPAVMSAGKVWLPALFPTLPAEELRQYAWRSFPSQLGSFSFGILLFFTIRDCAWIRVLGHRPLNLACLAAAGALFLYGAFTPRAFPMRHHIYSASFCLLGLCLSQVPWRLLVNRVTQFFGRISYSAYLLHFLVLKQLTLLVPQGSLVANGYVLLISALGIAITSVLAYASFLFIEQPLIRQGKQWIAQLEIRRRAAIAVP